MVFLHEHWWLGTASSMDFEQGIVTPLNQEFHKFSNEDVTTATQIATLFSAEKSPDLMDAKLKKFDKGNSSQTGVAYPNSLFPSSSRTLSVKLDKDCQETNSVEMAKGTDASTTNSPKTFSSSKTLSDNLDRNVLDINAVEMAKASNVNTTPIPVTSSSSETLSDNLNRNVLDSNALEMAKASNVNTTPIPGTHNSNEDDMPLKPGSWK
nr:hypothetical protein CFP56_15255 [Quercus suber]